MGSKSIRKIIGRVAPIAASFIPGIGPVAAAAIGAGGGLLSGGGLRGALMGGLTSGVGNYAASGGFGLLSNTALGRGINSVTDSLSNTAVGRAVSGLGDSIGGGLRGVLGGNQNLGYTPGEITSGAIGATGGITGGGGSSYLAPALSTALGMGATNDAEDDLLKANRRQQKLLEPFLNEKFTPGDLTQDPGYQFNLEQGTQALDRSQAARGGLFSGAAAKEAQQFGQGLADQTYNSAFGRWKDDIDRRYRAAGGVGSVYGDAGDIRANASIANNNILTSGINQISNPRSQEPYIYVNGQLVPNPQYRGSMYG